MSLSVPQLLDQVTRGWKERCQSQYIAKRLDFFGVGRRDTSTIAGEAIRAFEDKWNAVDTRVEVVPGKSILAALREKVQEHYRVGLTDHRIVAAFEPDEIPDDLATLVRDLETFRARS